jgi:hypothetical protein
LKQAKWCMFSMGRAHEPGRQFPSLWWVTFATYVFYWQGSLLWGAQKLMNFLLFLLNLRCFYQGQWTILSSATRRTAMWSTSTAITFEDISHLYKFLPYYMASHPRRKYSIIFLRVLLTRFVLLKCRHILIRMFVVLKTKEMRSIATWRQKRTHVPHKYI